jgi:hypothetical protein
VLGRMVQDVQPHESGEQLLMAHANSLPLFLAS